MFLPLFSSSWQNHVGHGRTKADSSHHRARTRMFCTLFEDYLVPVAIIFRVGSNVFDEYVSILGNVYLCLLTKVNIYQQTHLG